MPAHSIGDIVTREIRTVDAAAAARLSEELGYPVSTASMQHRIESLIQLAGHMVYVACLSGEVVGWIEVSETQHLVSEPRAEIGGLVVSIEVRGGGIGACLLACAEKWAVQRGLKSVVVRSRVSRESAHCFYLREGYVRTKTSAVFTKDLGKI